MNGFELTGFILRKLAGAVPLIVGVTLISFLLTVYFGPDKTYELVGKNPTPAEIAEVRAQLGYDRPFIVRYAEYLRDLATLDLGHAESTGEPVQAMLARAIPVSVMALAPGFVLGLVIAMILAMIAAWHRGGRIDRAVTGLSSIGMSLSFVVIIIGFQGIFGKRLGWFPVRGWSIDGPISYLQHAAVPTMALVAVNLGYNTRFFRAILADAVGAAHVRTARAFGARPVRIMTRHVLRASLLPIITRIVFSIPLVVISGSLLIESHFSIPGIGRIAYQAILSGDQPVLMAVVGLSAVLLVLAITLADLLCRLADPRIRLR
ncbi:MAG: ABC transporter permease [Wenzhouxiangella sp.]